MDKEFPEERENEVYGYDKDQNPVVVYILNEEGILAKKNKIPIKWNHISCLIDIRRIMKAEF